MQAKLVLVLVVTYCLRLAGGLCCCSLWWFCLRSGWFVGCVAWVCLSIVFDLDVLVLGLGC